MDEIQLRRQFDAQRAKPFAWGIRAQILLHAANVLEDRHDPAFQAAMANPGTYFDDATVAGLEPWLDLSLAQVIHYLKGVAIENFLKGALAPRERLHHKLTALAAEAGLS